MTARPFDATAIVGVHNTRQRFGLHPDVDVDALALEVAFGAARDAGLPVDAIDGIVCHEDTELALQLGLAPVWRAKMEEGVGAVATAAQAIDAGFASCVLVLSSPTVLAGTAGATAPWTRPASEFDSRYGVYTAVQYAMIARRHMHRFGTTPEAMATVAATIRNNGARHPLAAHYERGPYTVDDVLASRMVAEPFHLLECSIVSTGAAGLIVAREDIAADARTRVRILGVASENHGAWYRRRSIGFDAPSDARPDLVDGWMGSHSAAGAFAMAGLTPEDVDLCELYDPFSFEVIRQLEAYGFCPRGEGGDYVLDGGIAVGGRLPCNTDGGLHSFSHPGTTVQMVQRVVRATQQLRGECGELQVDDARVALCSSTSSGGMFGGVMLLGSEDA